MQIKTLATDFRDCWQRLPNKTFFLILFAAWLALFHLFGNTTLGYIRSQSPSLYRWVLNAYAPEGNYLETDDGHGILIPFIVLALFWWKRNELLSKPLRVWAPALFIIALGLLLHTAGYMG